MATPPLFDPTQDTGEEDISAPLKTKLASLRDIGQATSEKIKGGMQEPVSSQPGQVPSPEADFPPLAQPQQSQQSQQPQQKKPPIAQAPKAKPATVGDVADQADRAPAAVTTGPSAAVTTGPATQPISGGVVDISGLKPMRGLAYGPDSEGATAADQHQVKGAWDQPLQLGDIAVSPDRQKDYPLKSYVNVVDSKGNVVLQNQHVADTSMIGPGKPTSNTFELWNGKSLGAGYYLVPVPAPSARTQAASLPAGFTAPTASFAQGGIVTQPTVALVGEAGPEAIVPLRSGMEGSFGGIGSMMGAQTPSPRSQPPPQSAPQSQSAQAQAPGTRGPFEALAGWIKDTTFS